MRKTIHSGQNGRVHGSQSSLIAVRFRRYEVVDHSMMPTLVPGDRIVGFGGRPARGLVRGSVVVFGSSGSYLIKRVVGLPGERITIVGGVLLINQTPFDDPWWKAANRPDGIWNVPMDSWFVLGDNRADSDRDSRSLGPIPASQLHSRVLARYRPWRRAGRIRQR